MDLDLKGRKAFVTGGNAGVGFGIARALVREGASVGICSRDQSHVDRAAATLRREGGTAYGVVADVTVPDQIRRAVDTTSRELGGLDFVVASVGGDVGEPWLMQNSSADWTATFQLNVVHAADAVRAAVPHLRRSNVGSVLFIASITGWRPGPSSVYASSKAALIHLAASLAQELGPYGIRVNALSPGSVGDTEGWIEYRRDHPDDFAKFEREEFPRRRLVTTAEVADVACLVLSPRGSGVNGANITVDAGQFRPHAVRFPTDV
jgi:3-oxoacyl-[acyl-carrier protein] reductase